MGGDIIMNLKVIEYDFVDWINLVYDRNQW
jgi:hypothetical protein